MGNITRLINCEIFKKKTEYIYFYFQTLGSFMCDFIPFAQTFGILASSVALVAIALDRYRNVAHILHKKWNPSLSICLVEVFVVWIVCAGKIIHLIYFC